MTVLRVYKSYNFKDKDPIIDRLRTIIDGHGLSYEQVANDTGLTQRTIWNLFSGPTKYPRYSTVARIVIALRAYDFTVVDMHTGKRLKMVRGGKEISR